MCLMCEWYYDTCNKKECFEAATGDQKYTNRSGWGYFLWQGQGEPCEHIKANHGPECDVVKQHYDADYGWIYDSCSCYGDGEGGWTYD